MAEVSVIIPSYNSKRWIVKLLREILKQKNIAKIIIVDDNSPDRTANLIKKTFGKNHKVKLIVRKGKGGRGSAVIEGFMQGLKNKENKFFIEMDSDFAHDPKDIPKFLTKIKTCDAVFGSRYLINGGTLNYNFARRTFSFLANNFISFLLGINITDYTSGFRCYRRRTLESIDLSSIRSHGFITLSEIAYKIHKRDLKIGEIPIKVTYLKERESNFNLGEITDALVGIIRIRMGV